MRLRMFLNVYTDHRSLTLYQMTKFWTEPKLRSFAENKLKYCQNDTFLGRAENIVGKGEMLVTRIFSFSHNVFKQYFSHGR